jgi:hypothetical protein
VKSETIPPISGNECTSCGQPLGSVLFCCFPTADWRITHSIHRSTPLFLPACELHSPLCLGDRMRVGVQGQGTPRSAAPLQPRSAAATGLTRGAGDDKATHRSPPQVRAPHPLPPVLGPCSGNFTIPLKQVLRTYSHACDIIMQHSLRAHHSTFCCAMHAPMFVLSNSMHEALAAIMCRVQLKVGEAGTAATTPQSRAPPPQP